MANYQEFMDPNSAIARIIQQMQGAATRSNPGLPPGGAQAPGPGMPETMGGATPDSQDPNELIARLLAGQVNR